MMTTKDIVEDLAAKHFSHPDHKTVWRGLSGDDDYQDVFDTWMFEVDIGADSRWQTKGDKSNSIEKLLNRSALPLGLRFRVTAAAPTANNPGRTTYFYSVEKNGSFSVLDTDDVDIIDL